MCRNKKGERQLTEFEPPKTIVEGSSWGPVEFRLWCKFEAERFEKSGFRPAIHENNGGCIALFVN